MSGETDTQRDPTTKAPVLHPEPAGRFPALGIIALSFAGCVLAHFLTPHTPANHAWHHVHYLLFVLPIVLAGIWFGVRGGAVVALLASTVYAPYTFAHASFQNEGLLVEAVLEVMLYVLIGVCLGLLADRERRERARAQATTAELAARTSQLVETERQLAQVERLSALGRLAATIAHEVRNPLGSIKGSAEILRDDFDEGHPKHKFLTILVAEAQRLDSVLDTFLEFARPPTLELRPVFPGEIVSGVATLVTPQCRSRQVTLDTAVADDLPPVRADERQLRQAVLNLVLNALESVEPGGTITLRCTYGANNGKTTVAIAAEDTGPGIEEPDLVRVFEPFFSTKPEGTGLGLTAVRKIVEAHGGTVTLRNRVSRRGAIATITLPTDTPSATRAEVPCDIH